MKPSKENEESESNTPTFDKFDKPADWLRSFKGCEHYSDEEANEVISSLDQFASMLFNCAMSKTGTHIDNQIVISENDSKIAPNNQQPGKLAA